MQQAQVKSEKSPSRSSVFVMNCVLLRLLSLNYSTVHELFNRFISRLFFWMSMNHLYIKAYSPFCTSRHEF